MKKTPMIIIMLSCIAVSVASVVLSHSNDKRSTPKVKITEVTNEITTNPVTGHTVPKTTALTSGTNSSEISFSATETTTAENNELHIDINTADLETLCLLDGIGETIASDIIKYREENGGFLNIEEIMNVNRIGEKIFDKIRNNIYVESPYYPDESSNIDDIPHEESPHESETEPTPTEIVLTLDDVAPIELNSADKELLMYLPYVDESIADKIIELREKLHGFNYEYELAYIEELSDEQVKEILQYVYVAK